MNSKDDDARPRSGWRKVVDVVGEFLVDMELWVWAGRVVFGLIRWLFGLLRLLMD